MYAVFQKIDDVSYIRISLWYKEQKIAEEDRIYSQPDIDKPLFVFKKV